MLRLRRGGRDHARPVYRPVHVCQRVRGSRRNHRVVDSFYDRLGQLRDGVAVEYLLSLPEDLRQLVEYLEVLRLYSRLSADRGERREDREEEQQGHQQGVRIACPRSPADQPDTTVVHVRTS